MISSLRSQPSSVLEAAAEMLVFDFSEPSGWKEIASAREEVATVLRDGFALGLMAEGRLAGWIGGLPQYGGRVWELHPLVVRKEERGRGFGRALVEAFESEAERRGALTATLGADDDTGMSSLAGVDLYDNLPGRLASLCDLGRRHPFGFYQKLGYTVTGVVPDANGRGKPDIFLSKRVGSL